MAGQRPVHLVRAANPPERVSTRNGVPSTTGSRCLIVCFDGTSNEPGRRKTNVAEFYSLLPKDSNDQQRIYYRSGIGTTSDANDLHQVSKFRKFKNQAFAPNIKVHIIQGYKFLMNQHKTGDVICLFGFSRGAYIARALAGMLHVVGLLPEGNMESLSAAYEHYTQYKEDQRRDVGYNKEVADFKETLSKDVDIEFIGVWDTVASVGLSSKTLPFTKSNPSIRLFRHALALDERRIKFTPLYYKPAGEQASALEVWFSGCHGDVGGGSVESGTSPSLARIALRWMVGECCEANTGILFTEAKLRTLVTNNPGVQVDSDQHDATSNIHDKLKSNKLWYILEGIVPMHKRVPNSDKVTLTVNLGKGRTVGLVDLKCHRTVKIRMETGVLNYRPKAKWTGHPVLSDANTVDSNLQPLRVLLVQ